MEVTLWGLKAFIGAPIGEVHNSGGVGSANGHSCHVDDDKSGGVGVAANIARLSFEVDCNCDGKTLQKGDWIEVRSNFLLVLDVGKIEYSLCGGKCRGSTGTGLRGVGLGLKISKIRWVIDE